MDKIGADFDNAVQTIIDRLKGNPVPLQLPIGAEDKLLGVVDLVEMKAVFWKDDTLGASYDIEDIPAELLEEAEARRAFPD